MMGARQLLMREETFMYIIIVYLNDTGEADSNAEVEQRIFS